MSWLWAVFISLIPRRYRQWTLLEGTPQLWRAAIAGGFVQSLIFAFVSLAVFIQEAPAYFERSSILMLTNETGAWMNPVHVGMAANILGLAGYLLDPLHLLYAYLAFEGGIRAFTALAFSQILPTLPLGSIAAIHDRLERAWYGPAVRRLLKDEILLAREETYHLHVLSAIPKRWSPYIGIHFRGELYVLDGEESESGPRPFGYRLRKNPAGNRVVVTCNYKGN